MRALASHMCTAVQIMAQYTVEAGYEFEAGLELRLQKHLEDGADIDSGGNARSAMAMVERAIQANRDRMFRRWNSESAEAEPQQHSDANLLIAADFRIGVKLGADELLKGQLDEEVSDLIGMQAAKDW